MEHNWPRLLLALGATLISFTASAQVDDGKKVPATAQRASLEEVVVTARRREENIQETPVAVSAFGAEALQERGIGNVQDLANAVPSLEIGKTRAPNIFIRGVGERTGFARIDPAVGVYLDDLFLPRADGQLLDTVDVLAVQVLRGPQGTLFGKNTTGGAMVLNLKKPDEGFHGYIEGGVGEFDMRRLQGSVNFPISDNFYMKIAGNYIEDNGYIRANNIRGDKGGNNNRQSLVLQTRWDKSETFSLDTLLFWGKTREDMAAETCFPYGQGSLFGGALYIMWAGDTNPSNPQAYLNNCNQNRREDVGDFRSNISRNDFMKRELDILLAGTTAR